MNNTINPATFGNNIGQAVKPDSAQHMKTGDNSFGDILRNTTQSAIDTMRHSEEISAKAISGDANLNDVVTAVTAAELTLQTVVAVRDRVVNALQEVLRMPI